MKKLAWLILIVFSSKAQSLKGAFELQNMANERASLIITDKYISFAVFEKNQYIRTYGGTYTIQGDSLKVHWQFNDKHPESLKDATSYHISATKNGHLQLTHLLTTEWKRIDNGVDKLSGCWRISERMDENGQMNPMPLAARRTLKLMSESRFQWVAINIETGEFFGTGGGTYSLKDGIYTENIEFFSRDNARVGASLGFEYSLVAKKWLHSGKSSKGQPIKEVWVQF